MSDATGLVQRRRAAPKDENNRESPESGERNEDDDAGMDHDSKETRLTLMEEVLLLGLKDKGRWVACRSHFISQKLSNEYHFTFLDGPFGSHRTDPGSGCPEYLNSCKIRPFSE